MVGWGGGLLQAVLQSVAGVVLQRLLDELEAALVEERVLPLWLADVQVVRVHLDEVTDAKLWRRSDLRW